MEKFCIRFCISGVFIVTKMKFDEGKQKNAESVEKNQSTYLKRRKEQMSFSFELPSIVEFTGKDILDLYIDSKEFREIIDSGKYVLVDNRLVIKSEEGIAIHDGELRLILNDTDINEYCLKINRTLKKFPCIRHRRSRSSHGISPFSKKIVYNIEEATKIVSIQNLNRDNIHDFFGVGSEPPDPPHGFSKALMYFMEMKGYTVEKLASCTGLSPKTIQRMRTGETHPEIETVVTVCVGLHLGQYYGGCLLEKAGYKLTDTAYHKALYCCMYYAYKSSIEDCNRFMIRMGFKPLTELYDLEKF